MSDITSPATDRALKVPQVAERLACTEAAVYRQVAGGKLRAFKVGRLLRVRESAIREFIDAQEG